MEKLWSNIWFETSQENLYENKTKSSFSMLEDLLYTDKYSLENGGNDFLMIDEKSWWENIFQTLDKKLLQEIGIESTDWLRKFVTLFKLWETWETNEQIRNYEMIKTRNSIALISLKFRELNSEVKIKFDISDFFFSSEKNRKFLREIDRKIPWFNKTDVIESTIFSAIQIYINNWWKLEEINRKENISLILDNVSYIQEKREEYRNEIIEKLEEVWNIDFLDKNLLKLIDSSISMEIFLESIPKNSEMLFSLELVNFLIINDKKEALSIWKRMIKKSDKYEDIYDYIYINPNKLSNIKIDYLLNLNQDYNYNIFIENEEKKEERKIDKEKIKKLLEIWMANLNTNEFRELSEIFKKYRVVIKNKEYPYTGLTIMPWEEFVRTISRDSKISLSEIEYILNIEDNENPIIWIVDNNLKENETSTKDEFLDTETWLLIGPKGIRKYDYEKKEFLFSIEYEKIGYGDLEYSYSSSFNGFNIIHFKNWKFMSIDEETWKIAYIIWYKDLWFDENENINRINFMKKEYIDNIIFKENLILSWSEKVLSFDLKTWITNWSYNHEELFKEPVWNLFKSKFEKNFYTDDNYIYFYHTEDKDVYISINKNTWEIFDTREMPERELERASEFWINNLQRFHNYDTFRHILQNRELLENWDFEKLAEKPTFVILYPKSDYNNAFTQSSIYKFVENWYNIIYAEIEDENDMIDLLKKLKKSDLKDITAIFWGHGRPSGMQFSKSFWEEGNLGIDDIWDFTWFEGLFEKIYLNSCSTWKWRDSLINLANFIKYSFKPGKGVTAPEIDTWSTYEFDENWRFIWLKYWEGSTYKTI